MGVTGPRDRAAYSQAHNGTRAGAEVSIRTLLLSLDGNVLYQSG